MALHWRRTETSEMRQLTAHSPPTKTIFLSWAQAYMSPTAMPAPMRTAEPFHELDCQLGTYSSVFKLFVKTESP